MAAKTFELDSIGSITVYKRRSSRRINLSISSQGKVRVSIPTWMPYQAGINFARSKESWINKTRPEPSRFSNNQSVGKTHILVFNADHTLAKARTKIRGSQIIVSHPAALTIADDQVQLAAAQAAVKVLRAQAELELPKRTDELAARFNLLYSDLKIKHLSRRWGSCDRDHHLVLNLYLIQLPNELIDYVICHELTHTRYLNHGPDFWSALEQISPNTKALKRALRSYAPGIIYNTSK